MPRTDQLKFATTHRTLESAVNAEEMIRRFRKWSAGMWDDGRTVSKVVTPRVIAHRDGTVTVQYHLMCQRANEDESQPEVLCGVWFPEPELARKFHNRRSGKAIIFEDLQLVVPVFPHDEALPALKNLCAADEFQEPASPKYRFALALADGREFLVERVAAYRLGKRCVLAGRYRAKDGSTRPAYCKCVRPKKLEGIMQAQVAIGAQLESSYSGQFRTPKILFEDPATGVIISEAVTAPTLYNLLSEPKFSAACHAAGNMLRAIHNTSSATDLMTSSTMEVKESEERIATLSRIMPVLAESLSATLADLRERVPEGIDSDMVVSHGDFYDKQVLFSPECAWVIDIDTVSKADPGMDVGNFQAHLALRGIQLHGAPGIFQDAEQEFARGYGSASDDFALRAAWWRCLSLLRLVSVYAVRPGWRAIVPSVLELAQTYMEQLPITSGRYSKIC